MLTLVLNDDLNDTFTELNGETVLLVDEGGIDGNYSDNKMFATALKFNVPYSFRIVLATEAGYDFLGLFKNRYQNLQYDRGVTPERFKYNFGTEGEPDIRAPSDDYIISESGEKILEYTFGVEEEIITVAFGSDEGLNKSGFRIIMMPTNTYVLSDVDLLLSDFPADFFQGRVVRESKFGGEVTGYDFANCLFRNCEFSEAKINDSSLEATSFEECNCRNVTLRGITVDANTSFDDNCTLRSIFGVDIVGTTQRLPDGYEIRAGHFFGPFTSHVGKTFEEVDLQGVDFTNSNIQGTDLSRVLLGNNRSAGIRSGFGPTTMTVIKDESSFFGTHMSLSSDGSVLAVGIPRKHIPSDSINYAGMVKVYKYEGTWQQLGEDINIESPIFADQFGYSVALNGDGTRLLVGAVQHSSRKGFAKVYKFEQDTWTQVGSTIQGTGDSDRAGYDVDISRDGVRIAIGALLDDNDTNTNITNSGSISVYQLIDDDWDLVNSKIESEDVDDYLGSQVNISSDGTVVLGVLKASRGEARVYADKGGAWTLKGDAIPTAGRATLAGTGDVVFVTLQNEEGTYSVQAYKFQDGNWREYGSRMGSDRNLGIIDSVCTTADGLHILFHERQANGSQVFLYQWDGEDWSLKLDPIVAKTTQPLQKTSFTSNEISDSGNVLTIGDYDDSLVEIFQLGETILPGDYAILDNFLVKTTFGSNSETILAAAPELADATLRDVYLSAVLKNMAPGSDKLLAPSLALESSFLDVNRPLTHIIGAGSVTRIVPDMENNYYVIATDGDSFTAGIPGTSGAVVKREGPKLKISYQGRRYSLEKGKSAIIGTYVQIHNNSIIIIYIRSGTICFDGSELVETDQGYVPIRKIDKSMHTIRQQPIQQISCTRCADNQMVRIQKNAFGKATPNKDTLVTLKHKISYRGMMEPASHFVGRKGISLVESHNQVVFNVMLPTHTYMRVNNMLTETLHPECEL